MKLQSLLAWLTALPAVALYGTMFALAVVENFFPPIPADTLVAFGAFLAARRGDSAWTSFFVVWVGSAGGAIAMYGVGRRFGADMLRRRLHMGGGGAEERIRHMYERYGIGALFLSRFIPGLRAVMPPLAGALRIRFWHAAIAIMGASAIWYGFVAWLASNVGARWEDVLAALGRFGRVAAIVGAVILVAVGLVFWRRRRARKAAG